jgi:hypothetical protein
MKRKLKYISILVAILFVAGGLVGWQYRWSSLDTYLPTTKISFDAPMRTMAEHDEFMSDREWPYTLELDELYYFGSYHTNDPDDAQIADIVAAWDRFQPTVASMSAASAGASACSAKSAPATRSPAATTSRHTRWSVHGK